MKISKFTEVLIGAIVVLIAAVVGSYLSAKYSHDFQLKILNQQVLAQKKMLSEQMKFQEKLLERQFEFEKNRTRQQNLKQNFRDFSNRNRNRNRNKSCK